MRWILAMALCAPAVAHAQIDYRNLDHDRPTETEDAYPVERYAFELLGGAQTEHAQGRWTHSAAWGLEYGVLPNAEVGIGFTLVGGDWGGAEVSVLYNPTTESPWLPALAVRATASLDHPQVALKLIATRSWGRQRVHLNAGRTFGSAGLMSTVEGMPREYGSIAVDRTLFRHSALLLAEVAARRNDVTTPVEIQATVGARYQWTPGTVLDVGVTRGLRRGELDFGLKIGVSVVFGVRALMPRGAER